ncbi:hypothetical protein ACH4M4_37380 [Streptomyces sp. NPDC017254]|uniref:hypothetical protein n=1 Tax=unclassified Streptomyces TaxID=2593676 RepID=UPI0037B270A5
MPSGLLADAIRLGLGALSPAERKVAFTLLAAYPSAGFETGATLAHHHMKRGEETVRRLHLI